jgi:sensor histidine kinase regulating citrate/malate metabolism
LKDSITGEVILRKYDSINMLMFPQDALERIFDNVVSNAKAHGFTDAERKDYQIRFSWSTDGIALIVEIENNGTAIPSDRDTASLLEYGVSSALHQNGHNGIGCNEIDDIMQRYDGNVEIVSLPENEFPVKYVLTFNRSNTVRSFKL